MCSSIPSQEEIRTADEPAGFCEKPMLIYRRTSLMESNAQTLVNTVNCVGVMGKSIAKEFKDRDAEMFRAYKRICDQKLLAPGKLWLWKGAKNWTLNFPTKIHWRNPSELEWIESGLRKFVDTYRMLGITEISFPRLGCGNGGLNWDDVRPLMERYLSALQIQVFIHDYTVDIGLPEHMEVLAQRLKLELPSVTSFDDFLLGVRKAAELSADGVVDVESHEAIKAAFADDTLRLSSNNRDWAFGQEDLWGVWVTLQKGLLTREKAGWSNGDGGRPLLSVLCMLPQVRPIQIQTTSSDPELAVELKPSNVSTADVPPEQKHQLELAWR